MMVTGRLGHFERPIEARSIDDQSGRDGRFLVARVFTARPEARRLFSNV